MTTPTTPTPARKSGLLKWLKRLLWLSLIPVVLVAGYYSLWIYYFVYGEPPSSVKLSYSDPCGTGEYRLLKYKYNNGDGYYELVDRNEKVLDKSKFSEGIGGGAIIWSEDCLAVYVPSDDGPMLMEVHESGPARFEGDVVPQK